MHKGIVRTSKGKRGAVGARYRESRGKEVGVRNEGVVVGEKRAPYRGEAGYRGRLEYWLHDGSEYRGL